MPDIKKFADGLIAVQNNSKSGISFPEPLKILEPFSYGPATDLQPWITTNFVQSMDGKIVFPDKPGGYWVSRSGKDRILMDVYRSTQDMQGVTSQTVWEEAEHQYDYGIDFPELMDMRFKAGMGKQKVLVLHGNTVKPGLFDLKVFNSERIEPWLAATADVLAKLNPPDSVRVVAVPARTDGRPDIKELMRILRNEHGVKTFLCEGGPTFAGELLKSGLLNEWLQTQSFQVIGGEGQGVFGKSLFSPETAVWFEVISEFKTRFHRYSRMRVVGPRQNPDEEE